MLGAQEWTDYQQDESLGTTFLEVDRNLYPRLLKYYEQETRKGLLDSARRLLGPALAKQIPDDLSKLSVDHIDAALRLLPDDEAEKLWHRVSLRIPREADANWVENVTRRLLGTDGAAGKPDSPLRAAVRAAQLSALVHSQPDTDLTTSWIEVAREAPETSLGLWLIQRSIAGQLAATRVAKDPPSADLLGAFWALIEDLRRERALHDQVDSNGALQLIGSTCASIEGLIERAESRGEIDLLNLEMIQRWAAGFDALPAQGQLKAFAHVLAGRTAALSGVDSSKDEFERALSFLKGEKTR